MAKSPGFTAAAVAVLALGIGVNTAIFSLLDTVLLRPLPYRDADRLVMVVERLEKAFTEPLGFSPPDFAIFEREQRVFTEVAAYANKYYELSASGDPERIAGARVSPSLFSVLGVSPALGRTFTREEAQAGRNVVVLSYGLWRRRFGGDRRILGSAILLDRQPYVVVGIMPPRFEFPHRGPALNNLPADLWAPLAFTPEELQGWASRYMHSVIGRLKPGVTLAQARQESDALARRLQREFYPAQFRDGGLFELHASVEPFRFELAGRVRSLLFILQAAVGMVLLIACGNVANLLLSRAAARSREMAVRLALGAGRRRLIAQMLLESLPLALAGGALGLLVAAWGVDLLTAFSPVNIPRTADIRIDARVLGFTLLLCCGSALLFGLAPAWQCSRAPVCDALKESERGGGPGRSRQRLLDAFVTCQFALCLVLLIAAGLLMRSFARLIATDPGFRPENVLSLSLSLPGNGYPTAGSIRSFFQRLLERADTLPGVKAAGAATDLPLAVRESRGFAMEDEQPEAAGLPMVVSHVNVFGGYFEALGIRLSRGRFLKRQDGMREPVVVINETMARRYWPGRDPVGRRMKWGTRQSERPWMTIVGVVEDVKQGLHERPMPQVFEPYLQVPDAWLEDRSIAAMRSMTLVVRAAGDPTSLVSAVRNEVRALDPALPVFDVQTLERHVSDSVAPQRFNAFLLGIFGGLALLLASVGVYGVVAYSVTRRAREIGVRVALGARSADVVGMVIRRSVALAGAGIGLGLIVAFALTRTLSSLLYGTSPTDPATFAGVSLLLIGTAALASYMPARRAARVDPMIALRCE